MFKNRLTSRVAMVASVLIAIAAITVAATRSTPFAFIDEAQDFFGTAAVTTPTRTAAPLVQTGETKTSANSAATDLTYVAETPVMVDGSGNLVITDANGAALNDNITISCTSPNLVITNAANGPNESILLTSITGNITVNTLGGNDTLTLNLAGCDFIPAGGLFFNGGTQSGSPGDTLNIIGGSTTTQTFNLQMRTTAASS
ncbi:MAG: hypothetical protein IPK98_09705 [Chloracidobacterium sp.]|nr:hypothetical protein [Chloracidobacterium sp.]